MSLRRLFIVYLSALSLLLVSVVASMVITELASDDLVEDAAKINLAGRQRMLSQRIIYLAQDLASSPGSALENTRAELETAINQLQAAVHLFEESHAALSTDANLNVVTSDLYFQRDATGQSLDERVNRYLVHAHGILANPMDPISLAGLRQIEREGLLRDLDEVVSSIEKVSIKRVAVLQNLERGSLLLAIFIICVEVLLVFLPGHRFLQRTLSRLTDQNKELVEANRASEALRQEQAEFTYAVSHDLKSPANSIGLILDEVLIEEEERLSEDGREMLDEALAVVKRIGGQVEDILQYAWVTSGESNPVPVDLGTVAQDVLADLSFDISSARAEVTVDAPQQIIGHTRQIHMLIQNLIANALKFQPDGSVPKVHVSATALDGGAGTRLTVQDNGIGIAPEDQKRIFKLFERLHLRDEYPGTGLGLATCARIADNHGGSITVDADYTGGARFVVELYNLTDHASDESQRNAA
ncbi:sensor histidine kinase [Algirhabdus cladophorae]|uniref:sensor histidine kinase n=1 Tax=Algirhabdus cladophorae TaxID=3377108 RepID=UPI003B847E49